MKYFCPICMSSVDKTNYVNVIFEQTSYFCEHCNYFFIPVEKDVSAYYQTEYHDQFGFTKPPDKYNLKYYFSKPRIYARYRYFRNQTKNRSFQSFLEIGGGNSENFILFDKKYDVEKYVIVEPNSKYNVKAPNLTYINSLFEDVNDNTIKDVEVVLMFHVLEHIFHLDKFFQRIKQMNWKYLYLEVPNIANEKVREDSLLNHPHYHHFSKESIAFLLEKNNIKDYITDSVEPITYHSYKKVGSLSRKLNKVIMRNEKKDPKGMYLRTLIRLS